MCYNCCTSGARSKTLRSLSMLRQCTFLPVNFNFYTSPQCCHWHWVLRLSLSRCAFPSLRANRNPNAANSSSSSRSLRRISTPNTKPFAPAPSSGSQPKSNEDPHGRHMCNRCPLACASLISLSRLPPPRSSRGRRRVNETEEAANKRAARYFEFNSVDVWRRICC